MFIESSDHSKFEYATLLSPYFSGAACVTFWYHSYGQDTGTLKVRERNNDGLNNIVFKVEGVNGRF